MSEEPARVLVIEDDPQLIGLLRDLLEREGYLVDLAPDGQAGLHRGLTRSYDLLLVDRALPAIEGLDLIGRLRQHGVVSPVLVLSALGEARDRVAGLDAGAEDYLTKPFDIDELLARLRALLRRHLASARTLPVGARALNLDERTVVGATREPITLSDRECTLLAAFAREPRRVFTRRELMAQVFPDADSETVVDTYVHYLRRKLGRATVKTVRGRGYRLGDG